MIVSFIHNVVFLKRNTAIVMYINSDMNKEMVISEISVVLLFFCIKIPAINDITTTLSVYEILDFILTNNIFFLALSVFSSLLYLAFCLTSQGFPFLVGISSHVLMCI